MFERELMILGLRKQNNLLGHLLEQLEGKTKWDYSDEDLYAEMTGRVAKNLKKLREIKQNYLEHRN